MSYEKSFMIKICIIGLIICIVSVFFIQLCFVNGDSMNPTLKNGQPVVIIKHNYTISRGDIVVIKKNNKIIIKRIIGIPCDTIFIMDGYVYVNNQKYDDIHMSDCGNIRDELRLNEGEYFVLGDNRNKSIDSRFDEIGIIRRNEIIGMVVK